MEERNETGRESFTSKSLTAVLQERIELADYRDIHFNAKYHESGNSQLFCHKHSASRRKY